MSASAERAVLGALLADPMAFARVEPVLNEQHFDSALGRACWRGAGRLARAGTPIDLITLTADLERAGELVAVGGAVAVAELADGLPDTANVEHYAFLVVNAATKRELRDVARWLADAAVRPEGGAEDLVGETAARLTAIVGHRERGNSEGAVSVAERVIRKIERRRNEGPEGLALGWPDLDRILAGGIEPGALAIAASRPGVGKSALLGGTALHACERGERVLFFSLEMPREQVTQRLLATMTRIPLVNLRYGTLEAEDWQRVAWAHDKLAGYRLAFDDTPALSTDQILARARRHALSQGLDLVLVDYLGKCTSRGTNRTEAVGAIARGLKDAARALNVPVIAAAQLSRLNVREDRAPTLSDLRDSGEIEQEADAVILMHPLSEENGRRAVNVELAKHRNGPTGSCKLVFTGAIVRFSDYRGGPS